MSGYLVKAELEKFKADAFASAASGWANLTPKRRLLDQIQRMSRRLGFLGVMKPSEEKETWKEMRGW